jgi:23S rRNA (cytosine1962-C5)-methyltransferase
VLHRSGLGDRPRLLRRAPRAAAARAPAEGQASELANGEATGRPAGRRPLPNLRRGYTAAWLHVAEVRRRSREASRRTAGAAPRAAIAPLVGARAGLADGALLAGSPLAEPIVFRECGLFLRCDPVRGQKTGWFLDQRENRARVGRRAEGKTVLDAFSYTGGFALHAARGGATAVTSLDASGIALDEARANFALNRSDPGVAACRHETVKGDAFAEITRLAEAGRRFALVVLDPPALAHAVTMRPARSTRTRGSPSWARGSWRRAASSSPPRAPRGSTPTPWPRPSASARRAPAARWTRRSEAPMPSITRARFPKAPT